MCLEDSSYNISMSKESNAELLSLSCDLERPFLFGLFALAEFISSPPSEVSFGLPCFSK